MKQYTVAYDPELDLWAIIDPEGFTKSHETFKRTAVIKMRKLNNENESSSSASTAR